MFLLTEARHAASGTRRYHASAKAGVRLFAARGLGAYPSISPDRHQDWRLDSPKTSSSPRYSPPAANPCSTFTVISLCA